MSGQRGPLSDLAEVRQLHGNRNKRNDGVQAVVAEPAIPASLSAAAKREWRRVVPELIRLRLLARTDRTLLTAYCQAAAHHGTLSEPDASLHYVRRVLPMAKELGLTPNARLRMRAPEPEPGDDEGLD